MKPTIEEPRMSLGYTKGKFWVADDRYAAWTDSPTYRALLKACSAAGFTFDCRYSYAARRYTAEIITHDRIGESWYKVSHNNAFDAHPMLAITKAVRAFDHGSPLLTVLCVELDCFVLREKLLPMKRLEDAMEALTDSLVLALLR